MKKDILEEKLNELYNFTISYTENNGFPPSIRDICHHLSIKSTATAYSYINRLKEKGLIDKSPLKKRAITIPSKGLKIKSVPLVGTVRAGQPIFAVENLEGYCALPSEFENKADFALKVTGNSMINAGILEKDTIIVKKQETAKNGEIVVALVEDSATVKRFFNRNGKIILHPENDQMEDMIFDNVSILGVVKGLIRSL